MYLIKKTKNGGHSILLYEIKFGLECVVSFLALDAFLKLKILNVFILSDLNRHA